MIMQTEMNKTRVGIYTQMSAEATAAGTGFAPRGDKSPVVIHNRQPNQGGDNLKYNRERREGRERRRPVKREPLYNTQLAAGGFHTNEFRQKRYDAMRTELENLGLTSEEILAMKNALEDNPRTKQNANKLRRYCDEKEVLADEAKLLMLERKENELAEKAEREAQRMRDGGVWYENINDRKTRRSEGSPNVATETRVRADEPTRASSIRDKYMQPGPSWERNSHRSQLDNLCQLGRGSPDQRSYGRRSTDLRSAEQRSHDRWSPERRSLDRWSSGRRSHERLSPQRISPSQRLFSPNRQFASHGGYNSERSPSLEMDESTKKSLSEFSSSYTLKPIVNRKIEKDMQKKLRRQFKKVTHMINQSHPFWKIPEEYLSMLVDEVEKCVQAARAMGLDVNIGECTAVQQTLLIRCLNDETIECIESHMAYLRELCHGLNLHLTKKNTTGFKKACVLVNSCCPSDEFLHIIKKQNGYATENWTVFSRKESKGTMSLYIGMDFHSNETLKANGGYLYFCMERLKCIFV